MLEKRKNNNHKNGILNFAGIRYFLFSFFFFLFSSLSFSQVSSSVDSTKIKIGEEILYIINVAADSTDVVVFPEEQTFAPLEMIESYKADTTFEGSKFRLIKKYGLTQFDSGHYTIPPQRILINNKPFFTDSIKVEVNDVPVDTTKQKMFDIKPAVEVKSPPFDWLLLLYWLVPILLIIAIAVYLFRRKKRKDAAEKQLPPYEEAIVALKTLDNSQLLKENKSKEYYSTLTEIVKRYLDREVDEAALESTSDELITRLMMHKDAGSFDFDLETIRKLDSIFKRADLVKFAKMNQQAGQAEVDRTTIEEIINETHEAVPEPTEEELLEDEAYKEILKKKQKRAKWKKSIGVAISVAIMVILVNGATQGFDTVWYNIFGNDLKELAEGRWYKSEYGSPAIIIETPEILTRKDLPLDEQTAQTVKNNQYFEYGKISEGFYIAVQSTVFKQAFNDGQDLDLNIPMEGVIKGFEKTGAINIVVKTEEFSSDKGVTGLKAYGEFNIKLPNGSVSKQKTNYEVLLFKQEPALQTVILISKQDDKFAEQIKERIINSIELEISEKDGQ